MLEKNAVRKSVAAGSALRRAIVSALCMLGAAPFAANALPVLPGGVGHGMDTPAGRGGAVHRVTNLNASGAGSLKACVDASGPRVCIFEVSGTIRVTDDLTIRNPNITIAGQTAPSPGIMIRGAALRISTSDVLVQHIRVRPGDDPDGPYKGNRDALKIESPAERPIKNIVVDHCSFSWAQDETVALWNAWDNVTLSNNIIAEGLHWAPTENHSSGYGVILGGMSGGHATLVNNVLAHLKERNPLNRGHSIVFANNVVYNRNTTGVDLQNYDKATSNTIIGNTFIDGPDTTSKYKPIVVRTGDHDYALLNSSKVYVGDNMANGSASSDAWSIVEGTGTDGVTSTQVPAAVKSAQPPTWPSGLTRLPTSDNVAFNEVLRFAGARPADRDAVDARVVKSVRDRTGRIIACVSPNGTARCSSNGGGWPTLAQNTRQLTLPANHSEVTARGYTKLEVWLHEMSATVEGRSPTPPTAPKLVTN